MIRIAISDIIKEKCPELRIATIECPVENSEFHPELWEEINQLETSLRNQYKLEDINKIENIRATRQAYKALGKDPNRYRPSAEALCRRIIRGISLYRINTLVDLINLISLKTGYSIGGFDADLIQGDATLGVGQENEIFQAIGRGLLNIENLPVYRDREGGIGTPTSDEERTKISLSTNRLLMIINAYSGPEGLEETVDYTKTLLTKYAFKGNNNNFHVNLY